MLAVLLGCFQGTNAPAAPESLSETDVFTADAQSSTSAPGVLLIVLDDLGYGDTSLPAITEAIQELAPEWEPDIQTPSLEAFSAEGLSLTAFRADAPVCAPTRAALMTGLSPHAAGFWSANSFQFGAENQLGLRPGLVLLPELLSDAGVATSMVGKWHLGEHDTAWDPTGGDADCLAPDTPDTRGFDRAFGFLSATHSYTIDEDCGALLEGGAGVGLVSPADSDGCPYVGEHTTEVFTERAIAELDALQSAADPWFLYVSYNAPHTPVDDGANWIREAAASDHPDAARYAEMVEACVAPDNRNLEMGGSDYCLLVSHLDLHLGRLLDAAPDDALVIVMSDNGGQEGVGASNGHFRGTKGNIYNGGTVVPLVVRGPDLPAGMALDAQVTSAELFPTILEFAGVEVPESQRVADFPETCDAPEPEVEIPFAGKSRLALLQDGDPGCRGEIFQENDSQVALIWQDEEAGESWKLMAELVYSSGDLTVPYCSPNWQLYDQRQDPIEQTDAYDTEPELAQDMLAAMGEQLINLPYAHDGVRWHVCCFEAGMTACMETCGECMITQ
ncbi:MAG: arylsulfatase A-like enzyme [Myxococcota bacterium]|jgi:arylsulfatase A-like enzyme